jgi:hypothetical protein
VYLDSDKTQLDYAAQDFRTVILVPQMGIGGHHTVDPARVSGGKCCNTVMGRVYIFQVRPGRRRLYDSAIYMMFGVFANQFALALIKIKTVVMAEMRMYVYDHFPSLKTKAAE